jgi:WD40 repeat protein
LTTLWDVRTGLSLGATFPHHDWSNDVSFSPDSKRLITACEDGTASIWMIPQPDERPVALLERVAELVSGHRADPVNGLTPLTPVELQAMMSRNGSEAD